MGAILKQEQLGWKERGIVIVIEMIIHEHRCQGRESAIVECVKGVGGQIRVQKLMRSGGKERKMGQRERGRARGK